MKWKFLNSGVNSGKFNMDFDVFLAENFEQGNAVLRLYQWNPYCISLGANQSFEDIDLSKTRYHQIDVVKRASEIIGIPYQTYVKHIVYKKAMEDIEQYNRIKV